MDRKSDEIAEYPAVGIGGPVLTVHTICTYCSTNLQRSRGPSRRGMAMRQLRRVSTFSIVSGLYFVQRRIPNGSQFPGSPHPSNLSFCLPNGNWGRLWKNFVGRPPLPRFSPWRVGRDASSGSRKGDPPPAPGSDPPPRGEGNQGEEQMKSTFDLLVYFTYVQLYTLCSLPPNASAWKHEQTYSAKL